MSLHLQAITIDLLESELSKNVVDFAALMEFINDCFFDTILVELWMGLHAEYRHAITPDFIFCTVRVGQVFRSAWHVDNLVSVRSYHDHTMHSEPHQQARERLQEEAITQRDPLLAYK
mmetsp:Transcript_2279/g.3102  ORF Transcript_2279/g.3102 Transcript_2279/m.3102 type:complete len:118 (-) Transcript_2279:1034-1387(-)